MLSEVQMKHKLKLALILGVEFVAIAIVLILIFFSGKKQYTVFFDIDGGTLLSGSIEQSVTQGNSATPPSVAKEGHYLRGWSGNYREVTRNIEIKAIWEYVTTPGIEYEEPAGATYSKISGCYENLIGKVYVGAYHNDLKVLEIMSGAFKDCARITELNLLDGILIIGDGAFENCSSMVSVDLPNTVLTIGENAFVGCKNLKSITLPENLEELGAYAFMGCEGLEEVRIPSTVKKIDKSAFEGCTNLKTVEFYEIEKKEHVFEDEEEENEPPVNVSVEPYLEICESAFANCYSLESINLPETLRSLRTYAFSGCTSLKNVVIPKSTVNISSIVFDSSVTTVHVYAASKDSLPIGWASNWVSGSVNVQYGYTDNTENED